MRIHTAVVAGLGGLCACHPLDVDGLLDGASSDVPDEVMEAFPNVLGEPMRRHTAITGIDFHIPGVISSDEMSRRPEPVRRRVNGTTFWQVTGELSARVVDDFGLYYVIGPIDADGDDHRDEAFDPWEPATDPDDDASHPRAGLPGTFFAIQWPERGYNGGIVQHQAPADGGHGYPQAPLAWVAVDSLALLREGYAVVTVSTAGTAYGRKNPDGSVTVDTNPESGSGIFFTEDPGLWTDGGIYETDSTQLVSTVRLAEIGADDAERPRATPLEFTLTFPGWDDAEGWISVTEEVSLPPDATFPLMFYCPELMRDALVVFERFLEAQTGIGDPWSVYVGWSGSGSPAWQLATGVQGAGLFQFDRALGVPPGAGNYDRWREPRSGTRFDAFVALAGGRPYPVFAGDTQEEPAWADVDAEYPLQAPYVFVHGDADLVVSPGNPYVQANGVARRWPNSRLGDASLDDHLVILDLQRFSHLSRDQLFANWDSPPYDTDALWYDPRGGYDDAALNTDRVGLRVADVYARQHAIEGSDIARFASDLSVMPRTTPLFLAILTSLRAHAEQGTALPVSRVDPDLFERPEPLGEGTPFPLYPVPCVMDESTEWEDILACRDAITEDASIEAYPVADFELAAIREFASVNPLRRSTEPLVLPDVAAPLGYWYFLNLQLRRDFTHEELVARYGDHDGYVAAFEAATAALIDDALWDPALGAQYVEQVRASDVLRP